MPEPTAKSPTSKRGVRGQFLPGAENPKVLKPNESGIQKGGKHTSTKLRQAVLDVFFNQLNGEAFLARLARSKKERHLFLNLLSKAMPQSTELTGANGGPIDLQVLMLAKMGIANLPDADLDKLHELFQKMGVGDVRQLAGAENEEPGGEKVAGSGSAA